MRPQILLAWTAEADRSLGLPAYETAGAAGADLRANFPHRGAEDVAPGARRLVPTGLRISIPAGFEGQVRPRSGLALKHGIVLPNAPGTIDSDYRGALGVILLNTSDLTFEIRHGMRIAQLVIAPVVQAEFRLAETLDPTARGDAGFGSTGVF